MGSLPIMVLLVCLATSLALPKKRGDILDAKGNGILSCRPGVEFPRDCGNRCLCADDGRSANCTNRPCSSNNTEFDNANRQVYKEMDDIRRSGSGPVYTCEPFTQRKVNDRNGYCYCARSGSTEICSNRIGDPWGIKV